MADRIVSLDYFDELFANFLETKLDLSSNDILISYPIDGQISPKIEQNMIFIHSEVVWDRVNHHKNRRKYFDSKNNEFVVSQDTMRRVKVQFIVYGPLADTISCRIKEILFFDSSKQFLYKHDLALIPDSISFVNNIHERMGARWWERADLEMEFYNSTTVEERTGPFESVNIDVVPSFDIHIDTDS